MASLIPSVLEVVASIDVTAPSVNEKSTSQSNNVGSNGSTSPIQTFFSSSSSDFIFPANMSFDYPSSNDPIVPLDLFPFHQESPSRSDKNMILPDGFGAFYGTGNEPNTVEFSVNSNSSQNLPSQPAFTEFPIARDHSDNPYAPSISSSMKLDSTHYRYAPEPMEVSVFDNPPQNLLSGFTPRKVKQRGKANLRLPTSSQKGVAADVILCVCQQRWVDGKRGPVETYTGPPKTPGRGYRSDLASRSVELWRQSMAASDAI
ncbi:hypothetical protein JR316_0009360 [Psilocybe cubensis]|uniref:Uncharacterized protein n=2 Tax=Psilocybe cubensis TaxID=181762 RepID=A0A8H7XWT8_PSICU|nr:hypothetical protein JR316_0009360 [Psilocybe cubensis]KAH9478898.1 hypothetical protein JR316_0009360 [Psilocybe cubensis]